MASGTKLAITVAKAQQRLELRFKDDQDRLTGEVTLGREAVETFIAQLVAAREMLKAGPSAATGEPSGGVVKLPPPIEYYTMTAGVDRKSGLPVLGFKVGPELWISFRIEAEAVPQLARMLAVQAPATPPA